jgi:glucoamylase
MTRGVEAVPRVYQRVQGESSTASDFGTVAQHMFDLMIRNAASDGFVFRDPQTGVFSKPGCIIASPSYAEDLSVVDQDYVYNWTRDSAVTALEVAAAVQPAGQATNPTLLDYVTFARTCQTAPGAPIHRGSYRIDGTPRDWSDQSDGPALRIIATITAYPLLDAPTQQVANDVVAADLDFLVQAYQHPTVNLWEEHSGFSFFARAVQLRCFQMLLDENRAGAHKDEVAAGVQWLTDALQQHWDGTMYRSMLASDAPEGYDPNIDIVIAAVYGAVSCTDPKVLATVASLQDTWVDDASPLAYPINHDDAQRGLGPMFGRYPSDHYDGDIGDPDVTGRHPWALCTANVAEFHYRLASAVEDSGAVPLDDVSKPFFNRLGVGPGQPAADVTRSLRAAGDRMMNALVFHSDHLELSEQFDGVTGYEKSVRDLTWSYAAFLSAARARSGQSVRY